METANHKSEQSLEESAEELKTRNCRDLPRPGGDRAVGMGRNPRAPQRSRIPGQAPELPPLTKL